MIVTFEEQLEERRARKQFCAITGLPLALAETVVSLGCDQYADAAVAGPAHVREFQKLVKLREALECELEHLESEAAIARAELRSLKAKMKM